MTLKTFLLAVTATVAVLGAAAVGVPSTPDEPDWASPPSVRAE